MTFPQKTAINKQYGKEDKEWNGERRETPGEGLFWKMKGLYDFCLLYILLILLTVNVSLKCYDIWNIWYEYYD